MDKISIGIAGFAIILFCGAYPEIAANILTVIFAICIIIWVSNMSKTSE